MNNSSPRSVVARVSPGSLQHQMDDEMARKVLFEQFVSFFQNRLISERDFIESLHRLLPNAKVAIVNHSVKKIQKELKERGEAADLENTWDQLYNQNHRLL